MPSAIRLKVLAEIVQQMMATLRTQLGDEVDLNIGSPYRAIIEAASLQDADQYVQMGKLFDIHNPRKLKNEDLDAFGLMFGANLYPEFRRLQARTSLVQLLVGDGTLWKTTTLSADVAALATSFAVTDGSTFPASGALVLERGTAREEAVTYTRSGNVFTVIVPVTGLVNPHLINGAVETVSTTSRLAVTAAAATSIAVLQAGTEAAWPASGTVIFERSTVLRESKTFTRVGVTLTLGSALAFTHVAGTDVILSTHGSDRNIATGSIAYVPETVATKRISFRTKAAGVLYDGDYAAALILAESEAVGADTRVGSRVITRWQNEPFAGATVVNPNAASQGRDREADETYAERLIAARVTLISVHVDAIAARIAGKVDPFSGRSIAFAQGVPPVVPGTSLMYVTDGSTTFTADYQVRVGRDVIVSDARINERRGRLHQYGPFLKQANPLAERTPRLFKSLDRGVATLTAANTLEDNTQAWVVNAYAGFFVKTDDDLFYEIVSNTAIALTLNASGATPSLGSYAIIDFSIDPLIPDTDYVFNQTTGELELTVALVEHDALVAADDGAAASVGAYTYSRGLTAFAQRLINGDPLDFENYPGVNASGTIVLVAVPTIVSPAIVIQVQATSGVVDATLLATVKAVIQSYINSLGIGQKPLLAEIIRLVKGLAGVANCRIISPAADPSIASDQLPRVNASDIEVL